MNIVEKDILLHKLHDGKTEEICIQLGYPRLRFEYEVESNYSNNVILPKIIHFIWIGAQIPVKYVDTIINCKKINADYDVYCWIDNNSVSKETQTRLIENGLQIFNIYDILNQEYTELDKYVLNLLSIFDNYGYKADIIRLYVVYKYGGIYSDIDSIWIKPLDNNFDFDFVSYRIDDECSNCTNSFFGFHKQSVFIKNALYNLKYTIRCFAQSNNYYIFKTHIPVITGPVYLTRIIKESNLVGLNYIHQAYNVIGGPHEKLHSEYSKDGRAYCYQTFDKNWC
jgi:mannosyltransferase OCH1-like enzyme